MECPFCGCRSFYVKDPDDEYETHTFDVNGGEIIFSQDGTEVDTPPAVSDGTESYCSRCAWHGKLKDLKRP